MIQNHSYIFCKWLLLAVYFLPFAGKAQNLVVNGGFEDENTCLEYKVNCSPSGWVSTNNPFSNYRKEIELSHRGTHSVSVIAGHVSKSYFRNYLRTRLICGLRKGNRYRIEFYIQSYFPVLDSMGILFTTYDFLFEKRKIPQLVPSVYLADASVRPVPGKRDWQQVVIDYTADGTESFFTIGNFSKRDLRYYIKPADKEPHYFVFIDDVAVLPLNPSEQLCQDWQNEIREIYDDRARHDFVNRAVNQQKNKPVPEVKLQKTTQTVIDTFLLADVFFDVGRATLRPHTYRVLDSFCRKVSGKKIDSVFVDGFTDSTGSDRMNQRLSEDRARNVADYITRKMGFASGFITVTGFGRFYPLDTNNTPEGRQMNRRVEIYFYIRE